MLIDGLKIRRVEDHLAGMGKDSHEVAEYLYGQRCFGRPEKPKSCPIAIDIREVFCEQVDQEDDLIVLVTGWDADRGSEVIVRLPWWSASTPIIAFGASKFILEFDSRQWPALESTLRGVWERLLIGLCIRELKKYPLKKPTSI
jgi:hypothetical protein